MQGHQPRVPVTDRTQEEPGETMNTMTDSRPLITSHAPVGAGGPYAELVDQLRRIAWERTTAAAQEDTGLRGWLRHATSWS